MKDLSIEYDRDFCHWLEQNVALLRAGQLSEIDVENIAEELESMGKRDKRELMSRLSVLLTHLLKWQFQAKLQCSSWQGAIGEQREQIAFILEDSPSLKHQLIEKLDKAYQSALNKAIHETGLSKNNFPNICPYTLEQILDEDFYPSI